MNILVTSVGRRAYMVEYFQNALYGKGRVFAANSEMTYALQKADCYVLTPNIYDSSYVEFLLNYCKENEISILISLFDIDLPVLSKNSHLFEKIGVRVLVSSYSFVSICNDKLKTYEFLINNGFTAPPTYTSLERVKEAIKEGVLNYPLIIKPRWGMGSIGIFEAEDEEELILFYNKTKKAILKSYLKYESQDFIDESIIIQEKILGEEWGLDIFNDLSGNFLTCVPKRKLAMRAGETDIAQISIDTELVNFGKILSESTKHIGNLDLDFFINDKGEKYILEMNCRFGGQYPFSHLAGVDFPRILVALLEGNTINEDWLTFKEVIGFEDQEVKTLSAM